MSAFPGVRAENGYAYYGAWRDEKPLLVCFFHHSLLIWPVASGRRVGWPRSW